jgi:hypothetical protein
MSESVVIRSPSLPAIHPQGSLSQDLPQKVAGTIRNSAKVVVGLQQLPTTFCMAAIMLKKHADDHLFCFSQPATRTTLALRLINSVPIGCRPGLQAANPD